MCGRYTINHKVLILKMESIFIKHDSKVLLEFTDQQSRACLKFITFYFTFEPHSIKSLLPFVMAIIVVEIVYGELNEWSEYCRST